MFSIYKLNHIILYRVRGFIQYVDGQWLHVDVSANGVNNRHVILLAGTVSKRTDTAPEATAFLKELPVPGSTK